MDIFIAADFSPVLDLVKSTRLLILLCFCGLLMETEDGHRVQFKFLIEGKEPGLGRPAFAPRVFGTRSRGE